MQKITGTGENAADDNGAQDPANAHQLVAVQVNQCREEAAHGKKAYQMRCNRKSTVIKGS